MNSNMDRFLANLYDVLVREKILNYPNDCENVHLSIKVKRVNKYLNKLKRIQDKLLENGKLDVLKRMYYDRYIIKEEDVSEGYLRKLEERYLDGGHGRVNLVTPVTSKDKEIRQQYIDLIISEQKSSLDSWIDYLLSADSDYLDMWAKVWLFQGMLKIGNLDANRNKYGRRNKTTVNPFVSFDSEVMGKCVNLVKQNLSGAEPTELELDKLVESGNFAKLYGMLLANNKEIKISSNEGIWIKYNYETEEEALQKEQGGIIPEYLRLYNSLQGYNTGWCTAGSLETAKAQICGLSNYEGGDFYVYYSIDENGEYKIPRIAIRIARTVIGEIRGIAEGQNIEASMGGILEEKLKEFSDADNYKKRVNDLKFLADIYYKNKDGIKLTREELIFIYEINGKITTFGYERDLRIEEIKASRNMVKDLTLALGCSEEQIGFSKEDLNRGLIYYYGDITTGDFSDIENIQMPRYVSRDVILKYYIINDDIALPERIGGGLYFINLESVDGLMLPEYIGGSLWLKNLKSINDLILPKYIGGWLYLGKLSDIQNIELPEHVGGISYNGEIFSLSEFKKVILEENYENKFILKRHL